MQVLIGILRKTLTKAPSILGSLGAIWDHLGVIWDHLGVIWEPLGGPSWSDSSVYFAIFRLEKRISEKVENQTPV